MVVFDTSVIVGIVDKNPKAPIDPVTALPLANFKERESSS
jgi:hypothetical protein